MREVSPFRELLTGLIGREKLVVERGISEYVTSKGGVSGTP